jgi:uridine phosphorylase
MSDSKSPPILSHKYFDQPSVFVPENLLREARRQKKLLDNSVPEICVLDPDGDIVQNLITLKKTYLNPYWACYHTKLYDFEYDRIKFGIIGCAVGSSFAVLVAEELFASGCQLLISITSAGQIYPEKKPPYFMLIEKALRDEGTSYHYLPPSKYSTINKALFEIIVDSLDKTAVPVHVGSTWTTDAPFRETTAAIEYCRAQRILAVEMEAAALYAFAQAHHKPVICFANVTNQMGNVGEDFEKGVGSGSKDALQIIVTVAKMWLTNHSGSS